MISRPQFIATSKRNREYLQTEFNLRWMHDGIADDVREFGICGDQLAQLKCTDRAIISNWSGRTFGFWVIAAGDRSRIASAGATLRATAFGRAAKSVLCGPWRFVERREKGNLQNTEQLRLDGAGLRTSLAGSKHERIPRTRPYRHIRPTNAQPNTRVLSGDRNYTSAEWKSRSVVIKNETSRGREQINRDFNCKKCARGRRAHVSDYYLSIESVDSSRLMITRSIKPPLWRRPMIHLQCKISWKRKGKKKQGFDLF